MGRVRSQDKDDTRFCGGSKPPPYGLGYDAKAKMVQNLTRAPSVFCFAKSTSLPEGGLGEAKAKMVQGIW